MHRYDNPDFRFEYDKIMEMTEAPEKCGGNKWCQCKNVTQTGPQ